MKKDKRTVESVEDGTVVVEEDDDDDDPIDYEDPTDNTTDENTTTGTGSETGAPPLPQIVYKGCLSMTPLLLKYLFLKARQQCPLVVQLLADIHKSNNKGSNY